MSLRPFHLRRFLAACALALTLLAPGASVADSSKITSAFGRLMTALRLETSVSMGDTFAQGGLGLWLPVDPARHVRWGIDAFELGFARGVDDIRYRRSPVLLGVRITVGDIGPR